MMLPLTDYVIILLQALVQCKQVEEKLMERVRVCECIRQERDIALDALKKKGLTELAQEILLGNCEIINRLCLLHCIRSRI